jgi:hypothetical protein
MGLLNMLMSLFDTAVLCGQNPIHRSY